MTVYPGGEYRIRDTGRKVFHPSSCGRCGGAGCPIVELVSGGPSGGITNGQDREPQSPAGPH